MTNMTYYLDGFGGSLDNIGTDARDDNTGWYLVKNHWMQILLYVLTIFACFDLFSHSHILYWADHSM